MREIVREFLWLRGAEFVCGWLEESRITVDNGKSRTGNLVVRCVVDLCRNVYLAYSSLQGCTVFTDFSILTKSTSAWIKGETVYQS